MTKKAKEACCSFIRNVLTPHCMYKNYTATAHGLKHYVQYLTGYYVTDEEFIQCCEECGYSGKKICCNYYAGIYVVKYPVPKKLLEFIHQISWNPFFTSIHRDDYKD